MKILNSFWLKIKPIYTTWYYLIPFVVSTIMLATAMFKNNPTTSVIETCGMLIFAGVICTIAFMTIDAIVNTLKS
jgi:drug/metabolite transporter (DMT)-like permease